MINETVLILCDSAHGQYIPQIMIERLLDAGWKGISEEDAQTLRNGPGEEWYWEAWENVLNNATLELDGITWTLWQDGDLFAVAFDEMNNEQKSEFFGVDYDF